MALAQNLTVFPNIIRVYDAAVIQKLPDSLLNYESRP